MILTDPWTPPEHETTRGLWHLARAEAQRREALHDDLEVTFPIKGADLSWPFPYPSREVWAVQVDELALRREYGE